MWYDRIKKFYDKGYYTKEDVKVFVPNFISEEEDLSIIK